MFLVGRVRACPHRRRGSESYPLWLWCTLASLMLGSRIPQIVFWLPQGWRFWLACGKIGSSEDENSLQNGFFRDRVALTGGFFGAATQKAARMGDQIAVLSEMERFFAQARTYFQSKL